ncbi:MAG: LysE family translocator [Tannerellaceae bacterium]|jgi:threonine/homoserine/homoserine lactone efflux protein|nr:LysE family translocator [Tannerellaceae bacterium]
MMNMWGFLSFSVVLTLMPGPDILFVVMQSIRRGKKAGIVFALGLCTGLIFHVAAVTFGVSALVKSSPAAFALLKTAGAAYLFYLGIKAYIRRNESALQIDAGRKGEEGERRLYLRGICMNVLNPKVILFFLSFLPGFVDVNRGDPAWQICLLGLLFIIQAGVIFSAVAILASRLAGLLMKNPRTALWVNAGTALIYVAIGISVLFV